MEQVFSPLEVGILQRLGGHSSWPLYEGTPATVLEVYPPGTELLVRLPGSLEVVPRSWRLVTYMVRVCDGGEYLIGHYQIRRLSDPDADARIIKRELLHDR